MAKVRVGITQGDTNGVGYEVIIKALSDARMLDMCTPVVYGSSKAFGFYRKTIVKSGFCLDFFVCACYNIFNIIL